MSQFGEVACLAVELAVEMVQEGKEVDPEKAWRKAAEKKNLSVEGQKKVCPRCAFLGLAEEGYIKGIPCGSYINSDDEKNKKNKKYALAGVILLRGYPNHRINKARMWRSIQNMWRLMRDDSIAKHHNNQLDVVVALYENGYIT